MSRAAKSIFTILAATLPLPAYSQFLSFGIKGGIPATDAFQGNFAGAYQRRYIIGPTAELHLPLHLSFEVDALYRRSGFASTSSTYAFGGPPFPPVEVVERARVNDWQIPFLGKWEPGIGPIRPFIDAGVTYRHISGESLAEYFSGFGTSNSQSGPAAANNSNTTGVTIGGGIAIKLLVLRLSPEIRYTHWNSTAAIGVFAPSPMSPNQADFLVGFTF